MPHLTLEHAILLLLYCCIHRLSYPSPPLVPLPFASCVRSKPSSRVRKDDDKRGGEGQENTRSTLQVPIQTSRCTPTKTHGGVETSSLLLLLRLLLVCPTLWYGCALFQGKSSLCVLHNTTLLTHRLVFSPLKGASRKEMGGGLSTKPP